MVSFRTLALVLFCCLTCFGCGANKTNAPTTEGKRPQDASTEAASQKAPTTEAETQKEPAIEAETQKEPPAQPDAKQAQTDAPPAGVPSGEGNLWQTNFEASKKQAQAQHKLLLVDFTGSDWCGWCIKLKEEVFDTKEFQAAAPKKFVLVELDFPRQKNISDELKTQNKTLHDQYKVQGFPSILLLDAEGQLIARTGYRPGGSEKYVAHLDELVKAYDSLPQLRTALATAQGLDRAKVLDQLVEAYGKLSSPVDEIDTWSQEIITLDANNQAGLKGKYEYRLLVAESAKLKESGKFEEAKIAIDKALALPGLTGEQKQDAYFAQGECFFHQQDFAALVPCLKKAHEAAPESETASNIEQMIERFAPMAEAQAAVAKIKGELDQAQGLDRAKLLDQLIGAQSKLGRFVRQPNQAQEIEKWSQEIIALDADNKAGLKSKYLDKQKSPEPPKAEPKQAEPKQAEPKQAEPKQAEPKQAESKN